MSASEIYFFSLYFICHLLFVIMHRWTTLNSSVHRLSYFPYRIDKISSWIHQVLNHRISVLARQFLNLLTPKLIWMLGLNCLPGVEWKIFFQWFQIHCLLFCRDNKTLDRTGFLIEYRLKFKIFTVKMNLTLDMPLRGINIISMRLMPLSC